MGAKIGFSGSSKKVRQDRNDNILLLRFQSTARLSIFAPNPTHSYIAAVEMVAHGSSNFFFSSFYEDSDTFNSVSASFQKKLELLYFVVSFLQKLGTCIKSQL